MKVVVLGAGIIGTTSAYFLAKQGHEITVIDRQNSVAMETSHANAGCLSYGFTSVSYTHLTLPTICSV